MLASYTVVGIGRVHRGAALVTHWCVTWMLAPIACTCIQKPLWLAKEVALILQAGTEVGGEYRGLTAAWEGSRVGGMVARKLRALPKPPVRMGEFSCMRFVERCLHAVVQALITGLVLGWMLGARQ